MGAPRAPAAAADGPRGARSTRWSARGALGPSVEGLLDLALAYHLAGDLGGEVTACEQATHLDPKSQAAWVEPRSRAA